MTKHPPKKTPTQPGLGRTDESIPPAVPSVVPGSGMRASTEPPARRPRESIHREEEPATTAEGQGGDRATGVSGRTSTTIAWGDEAPTGTRPKARPNMVDKVGDTAVRIARTTHQGAPKPLASSATVAAAPIDSRAAFVLSLVDGRNNEGTIVDMSGMPEEEVHAILARLARLGLIALS